MAKLSVDQILVTLENQLREGKTYLAIACALRDVEPTVSGVAPTFFGLTSEGGFVMAQMCLARLYDRPRGTVTIPLLLGEAGKNPCAFQHRSKVAEAVRYARAKVSDIESVLAAIRHRRNTWFAHIDSEAIDDPVPHKAKAELTIPQLQDAFHETESIIKEFENLLNGAIGPICFLGGDDYEHLFHLIREAKTRERDQFDQAFEAQFGHAPPKS